MPSRSPHWRPGAAFARRDALAALVCLGVLPWRRAGAQPAGECVLTPDSGEGPFYFDPRLVRRDITEGVAGLPLELAIRVVRAGDCAMLADARVDIWHADALGLYSGYERQRGTGEPLPSAVGKTHLRGTQFTDGTGAVSFRTVYPSWYAGRTPHVHFKIFLSDTEVVASQMFFPDDVNSQVFATAEPYRERRERRDTFNRNDSFLRGRTAGAFGDVEPLGEGYRAELVVAVRAPA